MDTKLRSGLITCLSGVLALAWGATPTDARADAPKWVWVSGEGGWETLDLRAFDAGSEDELTVGFVPVQANGPTFALAAGARLFFLTLGGRVGVATFADRTSNGEQSDFELWTIGAEVGTRFTVWRFEPYVLFGLGYATMGGLDDALTGLGRGLDVDGVDLRAAAGLDFFLTRAFTVGLRFSGDALFLSRRGVPVRDLATPERIETLGEARTRLLEADGASAGVAWSITGLVGLQL